MHEAKDKRELWGDSVTIGDSVVTDVSNADSRLKKILLPCAI